MPASQAPWPVHAPQLPHWQFDPHVRDCVPHLEQPWFWFAPALHGPSPVHVPTCHCPAPLHVSVRVPQLPQGTVCVDPGVQVPEHVPPRHVSPLPQDVPSAAFVQAVADFGGSQDSQGFTGFAAP